MGVLTYTELPSKKITEVVWLGEVAAEKRAPVCVKEMSHSKNSQVCFTVDLPSAANDKVSEDVAVITSHPLQVTNHSISFDVDPCPVGEGVQRSGDLWIYVSSVRVPFGPLSC